MAAHDLLELHMTSIPPAGSPVKRPEDDTHDDAISPAPLWVKVFGGVLVVLLVAFIAMHLAGGGFRGHGT